MKKISKKNYFIDLMKSKSTVEDILMNLWVLYKINPQKVTKHLTNCKIQRGFSSKKWYFPKEIRIFRKIKRPNLKYSQLYADERTMLNKITIFNSSLKRSHIKKVLILGDDDLLSILLAANFKNLDIDVLEIDKKIIKYIKGVSKKDKYLINSYYYDIRKPLPKKFLRSYDYFFFDSSHCLGGYISFLTRAINSLSKNGFGGQFIFQLVDDAPVFTHYEREKLFSFINSHGLKINLIKDNSVTYEFPETLIKKFIKNLLRLFRKKISKLKLINFLKNFGFSEFLPGVSLMPEAIIELKTTKNLKYPINDNYDKIKEKKWGKMYFYQYYEK